MTVRLEGELTVTPPQAGWAAQHLCGHRSTQLCTHFSNLWICSSLYGSSVVKIKNVRHFQPQTKTGMNKDKHTYCQLFCLYDTAGELLLSSAAGSPSSGSCRRTTDQSFNTNHSLDWGFDSLPPPTPHSQTTVPLVIGQGLCELGLFDLQLVQLALKLLDACSVHGQVLVDL